jgi:hypothetical protein
MDGDVYDPKTYELAVHFLEGQDLDSETNRMLLARCIQSAVEDWFLDIGVGDDA